MSPGETPRCHLPADSDAFHDGPLVSHMAEVLGEGEG